MLLRFAFKNYKSFQELTEFSMVASKVTRHKGHIVEINGKRILKSAFVFGANAGGKSNFISALDFGHKIIMAGDVKQIDYEQLYFRLADKKDSIGSFQFDIWAGGHFYSYGFAMDYIKGDIVSEWLYQIDNQEDQEICLFSREITEKGVAIETNLEFNEEDEIRWRVYKEDFQSKNMNSKLFLVDVANRNSRDMTPLHDFTIVFTWFTHLLVLFPDSHTTGIPLLMRDEKLWDVFVKWLRLFDTGIEDISVSEVDPDKFLNMLPPSVRESVKVDLKKKLQENSRLASVAISLGNSRYDISWENGEIHVNKLMFSHGNGDLFEQNDESDGTRRLFDLLPLYQMIKKNYVIAIDELDRSFHTRLTFEFIHFFYKISVKKESQLIVTTHDGELLDLDEVRQDEIWFVERQPNNSTQLYSLSKFKARFDKDIKKDYLLGRYGALPVFKEEEVLGYSDFMDTGKDG